MAQNEAAFLLFRFPFGLRTIDIMRTWGYQPDCIGLKDKIVQYSAPMNHLPETDINCPYCGEIITLLIDDSQGEQQYIEDCQVCCRPINIRVSAGFDGGWQVEAFDENS